MTTTDNTGTAGGVGALSAIDRDESMDRTYIPVAPGWEIQTKGSGSTFRIAEPDDRRLAIPDSPYLHDTMERMARAVHAHIKSLESALGPASPATDALEPNGVQDALRLLVGAAGLMLSDIDTCGRDVDHAYRTFLHDAWTNGQAVLNAKQAACESVRVGFTQQGDPIYANRPATPPAGGGDARSFWFIEQPGKGGGWWAGGTRFHLTNDPNNAVCFPNKDAAERFMLLHAGTWADCIATEHVWIDRRLAASPARVGQEDGVDLCEVARELERVHIAHVLAEVAALACDRTDAYWSGHSLACEEIALRLELPAAPAQEAGR